MKSKKSLFFSPGLVVVALLILIEAFVILSSKGGIFKNEPIGEKQFEILNTYTEAEKALFYVDQSAKYSAYQAFYELANNGGCNEGDRYLGYSVWKDEDAINVCNKNIAEVKNNFYQNLNKTLNEYLRKFESMDIPTDNYILEVEDSNLIGNSKAPIKIPIVKNNQEEIGEYSIKPSFNVNINYDFSDYDLLRTKIERLQGLCKDSDNLADCIDKNKIEILNDDEFTLLETCESEEKEKLFEFTEYFLNCLDSEVPTANENEEEILGCVCRNRPQGGTYDIVQTGNDVIIRGDINEKEVSIKLENTDSKGVELENIDDEKVLHKDKGTEALITFLDIPENPSCIVKPKTKFRFCAQSNNNKFLVYEEEDKLTKLRNVIYKFALDFGETELIVPKPSKETEIPTKTKDINERIRQIAQEIGFENIEIAFKLAKYESNVQHCDDKTLNCGTDMQNNVNCHENKDSSGNVVSHDCGVYQINDKAHSDLFKPGSKRLTEVFTCKEEETVYDLDCNIKSGLSILQQYYDAYGSYTDIYNEKVDYFCENSELNQKYKSYIDPWDRALRAYNGFGCNELVASYVEKVNSAIT